jgi:hypothetical protein
MITNRVSSIRSADPLGKTVRLAWLTDTHNNAYGLNYFLTQSQWVSANAAKRNIQAWLHTGDMCNEDGATAWGMTVAAIAAMGSIPGEFCPGNHDYSDCPTRATLMNSYAPPSSKLALAGVFEVGKSENTYSIMTLGGMIWLVLSLEFGPRDAALAWADGILKANAAIPTIVLTHAFVTSGAGLTPSTAQRYDYATYGGSQPYDQHGYLLAANQNDAAQIWTKLLLGNPNVVIVLSGHYVCASGYVFSSRPSGNGCHQVLQNFQWYEATRTGQSRGNPTLFEIELDYVNNTLVIGPGFSPILPESNPFIGNVSYDPTITSIAEMIQADLFRK